MPAMTTATRPARFRIESVDVLRGIIMIVMALDHVREFVGTPGIDPTNLATTTTAMFFTRWITHFCAPVFFLLTGTGAFLSLRRKTITQLSRFLRTRGLWLIFLELVVTRCLGWQFNFDYRLSLLSVLWALGCSMIVLAALVHLPVKYVGWFGVVLIAGHNLLDPINPASLGALAPVWSILHVPGFIISSPRFTIFEAYPLIPWIGVTAAGYALGQVFNWDADRRRDFLLRLGVGLVTGFVVLRTLNIYGDPNPWSTQRSPWFTFLSFINTTKYAPSLLFLLMTLGPAVLLLRVVDSGTPRFLRPALTVGKVPLLRCPETTQMRLLAELHLDLEGNAPVSPRSPGRPDGRCARRVRTGTCNLADAIGARARDASRVRSHVVGVVVCRNTSVGDRPRRHSFLPTAVGFRQWCARIDCCDRYHASSDLGACVAATFRGGAVSALEARSKCGGSCTD